MENPPYARDQEFGVEPLTGNPSYMSIKEFVEFGFLQEANRRFFHPLGLALVAETKENDAGMEWVLAGVVDGRNDPVGILFESPVVQEVAEAHAAKYARVEKLMSEMAAKRSMLKGCNEDGIQSMIDMTTRKG
jgi:hypothetical protein